MTEFELHRLAHDALSTHSQLFLNNTAMCHAVERAISGPHPRIPGGRYKLACRPVGQTHLDHEPYNYPHRFAPWYRGIIEVTGVPARSAILIHPANWASQLEGCVAPAMDVSHSLAKGFFGASSGDAFADLYKVHLYPALDAGDTFLVVRDFD